MEITRLVSELNSLNSDRTRRKTQHREFASRDKEQDLLESRLNRPTDCFSTKVLQREFRVCRTLLTFQGVTAD
jgi:hypothetical protein